MKAFVTGGSGFLGRHLISALLAKGWQVRALARSPQAAEAVQRTGAEPVRGDLDDRPAMQAGMAGCDVVFHCAAKLGDWGALQEFVEVNVHGTERVLAAARSAGVPRLVHVSTEAVLVGADTPPLVNVDETRPRPARPLGLYPSTKALAEKRVLDANSPGLATVVVRPRFIWGGDGASVVANLVQRVRAGQWMWIDGGRYPTSTCNVENVCEGMILAAERGKGGEIYFLTDGPPVETRKFLTELLRTQGVEPGNRSIPGWLARTLARAAEFAWRTLKLKGNPPVTLTTLRLGGEEVTVNDAKARRELGYQASTTMEAGLASMKSAKQ